MNFALDELYDSVEARFAADGLPVSMAFGWRALTEHGAGGIDNRIVWSPGDSSDRVGITTGPASVTARASGARILGQLQQLCRITITAVASATDPDNERLHWRCTMALRYLVYSAIAQGPYASQVSFVDERYVRLPTRMNSATIELTVAIWDQVTSDTDEIAEVLATGLVDLGYAHSEEIFDAP